MLKLNSKIAQRNGHFDSFRETEKMVNLNLDNDLQRQCWFWQEKTIVNWHVDGDRNTSYFYRIAKIKKNITKVMSSIRVGENFLTKPLQIIDHVVQYYTNLFYTNFVVLHD